MALPTLLLSPAQSRDRAGLLSPAIAGPRRMTSGRYGEAWRLEEGVTNLVPNPSFEQSATGGGWAAQGVTFERDLSTSVSGGASAKIINGTGALGIYTTPSYASAFSIKTTAGLPYTVSWSMKSAQPNRRTYVAVIFRDANNVNIGATQQSPLHTLTSEWQRLTFSAVAPAGSVYAYLVFYTNIAGAMTGDVFWIDAVQFGQKAYATTYADGSLGPGYRWTGTAHASTSIRDAGAISVPVPGPLGAVLVRYRESGVDATAHLTGVTPEVPGTFGLYGTVRHDGTTLTIGTTRETRVESVLVYPEALPAAAAQRLTDMPQAWTWDAVLYRPHIAVSRVQRPKRVAVARTQRPSPIAVTRSQRT